MNIGILAGETSGDLLGAGLISALRQSKSNLTFSGVGGQNMIASGCHSFYDMERLAVMGLVEPLKRLPELLKMRRSLYRHFTQNRPDVFIGIDYPGFNLGLELQLREIGIPVIHYVSPSVWAWGRKRIFKIAKAVDLMLTLLPFEADFYHQHNVPVKFVGHPLADLIPLQTDKLAAKKVLGIDSDMPTIALLPGSRRNELKYLAEIFVKAANLCWKKKSNLQFITSAVNAERDQEFKAVCQQHAPHLPIKFFRGQSHAVMAAADVVLVTSGTATLETMLFKRPMVIAYRMAEMTYQIARYLVKTPFIGLPNLLANENLVPEFIQHAAHPEALSQGLLDFLNHPEKVQCLEEKFIAIHKQLQCDANHRAAEAVLHVIARLRSA